MFFSCFDLLYKIHIVYGGLVTEQIKGVKREDIFQSLTREMSDLEVDKNALAQR